MEIEHTGFYLVRSQGRLFNRKTTYRTGRISAGWSAILGVSWSSHFPPDKYRNANSNTP